MSSFFPSPYNLLFSFYMFSSLIQPRKRVVLCYQQVGTGNTGCQLHVMGGETKQGGINFISSLQQVEQLCLPQSSVCFYPPLPLHVASSYSSGVFVLAGWASVNPSRELSKCLFVLFCLHSVSDILEFLILGQDKFSSHNYWLNVLKGSKEINKYRTPTFITAKATPPTSQWSLQTKTS